MSLFGPGPEGQSNKAEIEAARKLGRKAAALDEMGEQPDPKTAEQLLSVGKTTSTDPAAVERAKKAEAALKAGYADFSDRGGQFPPKNK